jgi:hypothetical protein
MNNKTRAANILVKMTWLRNQPILATMQIDINQVDWVRLDAIEWTPEQNILIEVLRFLLTDTSEFNLTDLLSLDQYDREAVLVALHTRFALVEMQETLVP